MIKDYYICRQIAGSNYPATREIRFPFCLYSAIFQLVESKHIFEHLRLKKMQQKDMMNLLEYIMVSLLT